MKILIEGWKNINHSYSLLNQFQIVEFIKKKISLYHKEVPFFRKDFISKDNLNSFDSETDKIINSIKHSSENNFYDITYRISFPYNFNYNFNSKLLIVYGTSEFQTIDNLYTNGDINFLNKKKNFFIHTPSTWSKIGFINAGFRDDQIIVVPSGVNTKLIHKLTKIQRDNSRKKFNFSEDDFVLLNIGSMTSNKGIDLLLLAYGILKKKYPNLKLILKDLSTIYKIKPQDYIKQLIAKDNPDYKNKIFSEKVLKDITIVSKNLNFFEINELYNLVDCYVSPYKGEGFNLTPLEAAACGTPIIVTKNGSTDDYFKKFLGEQIDSKIYKFDNKNILKPNIESLIQSIERIINDNPRKNEQLRVQYINENYTWEKIVSKLIKIFQKKLINCSC